MLEFVLGMAVAYAFTNGKVELSPATSRWIAFIGIASLTVSALIPDFIGSYPRLLIFGIPCGLIAAAVVLRAREFSAPRWLMTLGDASYSLYLTHGLTMLLFRIGYTRLAFIRALPRPAYYFALLVAVFPIGLATFYCIEKPVTAFLKSRLTGSRRSVPSVTHAAPRIIS